MDRRQFLRGAGRLVVAAGCGGVLASVAGCGTTHHSLLAPTTTGPPATSAGTSSGSTATSSTATSTAATAEPTTVEAVDWSQLASTLTGRLVLPADTEYATARQEYNARFDAVAPVALAYCATPDDVARCLAFARSHGVTPVPRGGGHSFAGWSTGTGLVIDVSAMNTVAVDAAAGTVTVGAGAKLIDLYATLAGADRALAGGSCPSVGIAGLTLGGGMGVIDRKYGLTCDALDSLNLVTADSRSLTCSPESNTDLWWASRGGGGGSFAIATSFTFSTHPVGPIALFTLEWPWAAAAETVAAWQAWGPATPDELWSNCQLLATSGGGVPKLKVSGVHLGTVDALSDQLSPLTRAVGAALTYRFVGEESYLNAMLIEAGCSGDSVSECRLAAPGSQGVLPRALFAAKSDFLTTALPAAGVEAVVRAVTARQAMSEPGNGAIVLDLTGGAINQVPAADTAFVHRDTQFLMQYNANWAGGTSSGAVAANLSWLGQAWAPVRPFASGQAYQNYADPDLVGWQQAYYGANFARLTTVKATYDPDDVFHSPQSIPRP